MASASKNRLPRLYCNGTILGFKRGKHAQSPNQTILTIENVSDVKSAKFYLGKRVAYIYRAKKARKTVGNEEILMNRAEKKTTLRVIWGKVTRAHGNSGAVKAKFAKNLPPISFGSPCRIVRKHVCSYLDVVPQ